MVYYYVWVRSPHYRGFEPLTYKHPDQLVRGTIVSVPLRDEIVPGFVLDRTARPRFATKLITTVADLPPLPESSLRLAAWLLEFYPSPIGVLTGLLLPASLRSGPRPAGQAGTRSRGPDSEQPPLTGEQTAALRAIDQPDTFLLHGRTGSGKTRIYTELAQRMLARGRSAIILSPEIGLTSQLASSFRALFGEQVVVLHSQLTPRERTAAWLRVLCAQQPLIVIGPRSALFSPIRNLGLIVIDECHDAAYKQEQPPYYQTIRVAGQLARLERAIVVLGSATPAVTDYYLARAKQKVVIRLEQLAKTATKRHVTIVDLKDRGQFTQAQHLSAPLLQAIGESLRRHEQSLLYLNRRGTARVVICQACGWQAICPNCDLPLTFHADKYILRCHVCGKTAAPYTSCPACSSSSLRYRSFGTKAINEEVSRAFPEARILRFDADNAKAERLESQFERIAAGEVDILIGTQLLAKGLDLPRLSTLGVVLADSSLYVPDYTAAERTYQLVTQVIGRIGRGHLASQAIVQTYHPDSPLLKAALTDDWQSFYNNELAERRRYYFPPFCYLLKLSCRRATAAAAQQSLERLKQLFAVSFPAVRFEGPAPAFHEKAGPRAFQWQLIAKASHRSDLTEMVRRLPRGDWSYDLDPADLL